MEKEEAELAKVLHATFAPDTVKAATEQLQNAATRPGFLVTLLKLLAKATPSAPGTPAVVPLDIAIAGSTFFKNFIMKHWVPEEEGKDLISKDERDGIKKHLVALMVNSPAKVQAQLSQALAIISKEDFPHQWGSLLPELVQSMATDKFDVLIGVLETAHCIFYHYRVDMKSERLWQEIKYVVDIFQQPFTELFKKAVGMISQLQNNGPAINQLFKALHLMCEIFYSLNAQDFIAYFDDHKNEWFGPYKALLQYKNDLLKPKDEDEPGPLELVQTSICETVAMFAAKYEEPFQPLLPGFVQETWSLLSTLSDSARYDQLVTWAIRFMTEVVRKEWNKSFFANPEALKTICVRIVIPQIKLRESDIELFEMDGLEYVRRDMEGSDVDTRRRTTVDFVKGLCRHFETEVTAILKEYIVTLISEYEANRAKNWIHKDAAMYLVIALAAQGKTEKKGITRINPYVNVLDFFEKQVLPELQSGSVDKNRLEALPVLKADCLKFLTVFRAQLPKDAYAAIIPLVSKYLASENYVVHTYAAHAIERLMTVRDESGQLRLNKEQLSTGSLIQDLLTALFTVLAHEESKENEYVMKAIMRVTSVAQEKISPFAEVIIKRLATILDTISANPRQPVFNHYVFETMASLIWHLCSAKADLVAAFEAQLFPLFTKLLSLETCLEFQPYIFQLLGAMFTFRPAITDAYTGVFRALLAPPLWDNKGNVPPIVSLFLQYLRKAPQLMTSPASNLEGMLGVFQKLISVVKTEHYGIALVCGIIEYIPLDKLGPYVVAIFNKLLTRLSTKRTPKFAAGVAMFMLHFIGKHGFANFAKCVDSMQPGLSEQAVGKIIAPSLAAVTAAADRRTVAGGAIALLTRTPAMLQPPFVTYWPQVLEGLVAMFERPEDAAASAEHDAEEDLAAQALSTAFARLAYAHLTEFDPHGESLKAPKQAIAAALKTLPADALGALTAQLSPQAKEAIQKWA